MTGFGLQHAKTRLTELETGSEVPRFNMGSRIFPESGVGGDRELVEMAWAGMRCDGMAWNGTA